MVRGLGLEQACIAAVTFAELQTGALRTRRQDPSKAAEIETWIEAFAQTIPVAPMNRLCFQEYARLIAGTRWQLTFDAMIAATARVHNLIVATRNVRDFAGFDVELFNPFDPAD